MIPGLNYQKSIQRIAELSSWFVQTVKALNAMDQFDINRTSEDILIPLFKEVYGWENLVNLNTKAKNYPGIDLGDEVAGVAIQVTSDASSAKIKETLETFVENEDYRRYQHLIVYIITEKQGSYRGTGWQGIVCGRFSFEKSRDIRDHTDLLKKIQSLPLEKVERIRTLFERHFLENPSQPPPFMAEPPPPDFVDRPDEYEQLIGHLLSEDGQTVAITAALQGAGGFGKTTLAQAICHDLRIEEAYPDGILWVTIGDDFKNVLPGLRKLFKALTGKEAQFVDENEGATQLGEALGEKRCLMVVDDVWNQVHLRPFLTGGERCSRLITTRIEYVPPKEAELVRVDAMRESEAESLLGADLPEGEGEKLGQLAKRLGEWPLLLRLVNRVLFGYVKRRGLALSKAIDKVARRLDAVGLTAFDLDNPAERNQAVAASVEVSLRQLQQDGQARFKELVIFPKDTTIAIDTIATLWGESKGLSLDETEILCEKLADLSLLLKYDLQQQTVTLHDVMHHYLLSIAEPSSIKAWQQTLLHGYEKRCSGNWSKIHDDGYYFQYLLWHMREAKQNELLEQLLRDYDWLRAKLRATDITALINDFDLRGDRDRYSMLGLLQDALRLSAHVLARDKQQLASQLLGRLSDEEDEPLGTMLDAARSQRVSSMLLPLRPSLMPPGGPLIFTLAGHIDGVSELLLMPDNRRLITACGDEYSRDTTVKVWDVESGQLLHSLDGHTNGVSALLLLPNGRRLISACGSGFSPDPTVKMWDVENGELLNSLEGHTNGVSELVLMPDSRRLISACGGRFSSDTTVKVWDVESGKLLHSLEGHTSGVSELLLMPDGRYLFSACSGSIETSDTAVKVWDMENGELLHSLEGHTSGVSKLVLMPDGQRLISACGDSFSSDTTVKVWDVANGKLLHSLEGHTAPVSVLAEMPKCQRLISACGSGSVNRDTSVKVWDVESGQLLHTLEGHTGGVSGLLLMPDERHLIAACGTESRNQWKDLALKVWDLENGRLLHSLEGHTDRVSKLLLMSDDRHLITACAAGGKITDSRDTSVKVWDVHEGQQLSSLDGHTDGVSELLLTPDEQRLVSACGGSFSRDTTVKVWDIERGQIMRSLEGQSAYSAIRLLTTDRHLLFTACYDMTVKVWDVESRQLLYSLRGHTSRVSNLQLMPDNRRLISSCGPYGDDPTVKVWDMESGHLLRSFEGHTSGVSKTLLTSDGHILISGCTDTTVKVWSMEGGYLLHSLEGHTSGVSELLLIDDCRRLVSACGHGLRSDNTVKVWDVESGQLLHSLKGHKDGVSKLLLMPDGRRLLTADGANISREPTVKVWDVESGQLLHSLEGHTSGVLELLLTPDDCRLITACKLGDDSSVKVWDVESGHLLHSLEGHTDGVSELLLLSDGLRLVTACGAGSRDPTIKVWDVESGQLLHSLEGHTSMVWGLHLLEMQNRLISVGQYRLNIWNLESASHLAQFTADGNLTSLNIAPNGTISAGDGQGRVHFLRLIEV